MPIFRRNRNQPERHDRGGSPPGGLPWEPRTDDVGLSTVDAIGYSFTLDAEWAIRDERGFTWWGKDLAQRVWAESGVDDDGIEIFRLHARTDLFRDFEASPENLLKLNALAGFGTTSGFLVDEEAGTVQLAASMYVHKETENWVRRTFQLVAAMQAADAQIKADNLAGPLNVAAAASEHPVSGPRPYYDDMLNVLEQIALIGLRPSVWVGEDIEWTTQVLQGASNTVLATGDASGLSAEFPFQARTSLLSVTTEEANPQVGNGVLVGLHLPTSIGELEGVRFAAELARRELNSSTRAHYLGNWCWVDDGMHFVSFFPNMLRIDGAALLNLVMSATNRARWVAETFYGDDWEGNRDEGGRPLATPAILDN